MGKEKAMKEAIDILREVAQANGYNDEVDMICIHQDIDAVIKAMKEYAVYYENECNRYPDPEKDF